MDERLLLLLLLRPPEWGNALWGGGGTHRDTLPGQDGDTFNFFFPGNKRGGGIISSFHFHNSASTILYIVQ